MDHKIPASGSDYTQVEMSSKQLDREVESLGNRSEKRDFGVVSIAIKWAACRRTQKPKRMSVPEEGVRGTGRQGTPLSTAYKMKNSSKGS